MNGEIDRGCLRCGKENYTPAGKVDDGPPILAFCGSCVKVCDICNTARKLSYFWPNKKSRGWIDWRGTSRTNIDPERGPAGDELGPMQVMLFASDFLRLCKVCVHYGPEEEPKEETIVPLVLEPPSSRETTAADLRAQYNELIGRRL